MMQIQQVCINLIYLICRKQIRASSFTYDKSTEKDSWNYLTCIMNVNTAELEKIGINFIFVDFVFVLTPANHSQT